MGSDDRESGERSISVGDEIIVSTSRGDEYDAVTRIVMTSTEKGVWLVQTAQHGRVVVLAGRQQVFRDGVAAELSFAELDHRSLIGRLSSEV